MSKSAKKRPAARAAEPIAVAKAAVAVDVSKTTKPRTESSNPVAKPADTGDARPKKSDPGSKQSRVIAMLRSPTGATIAAMMRATGWQQHSVRGFLAGVVRKRLKLELASKKVNGTRIYQIASGDGGSPSTVGQSKRRSA